FDCPSVREFCRESRCLCLPSYRRDNSGSCVWNVPDMAEPFEDQAEAYLEKFGWYGVAGICFAITLIFSLCFCLPLYLWILKRKPETGPTSVRKAPFIQRQISNISQK